METTGPEKNGLSGGTAAAKKATWTHCGREEREEEEKAREEEEKGKEDRREVVSIVAAIITKPTANNNRDVMLQKGLLEKVVPKAGRKAGAGSAVAHITSQIVGKEEADAKEEQDRWTSEATSTTTKRTTTMKITSAAS